MLIPYLSPKLVAQLEQRTKAVAHDASALTVQVRGLWQCSGSEGSFYLVHRSCLQVRSAGVGHLAWCLGCAWLWLTQACGRARWRDGRHGPLFLAPPAAAAHRRAGGAAPRRGARRRGGAGGGAGGARRQGQGGAPAPGGGGGVGLPGACASPPLSGLNRIRSPSLAGRRKTPLPPSCLLPSCSATATFQQRIRSHRRAPQESLHSLRSHWQSELQALREDLGHRRRLMAAAVKARQEDEDIKVGRRLWPPPPG